MPWCLGSVGVGAGDEHAEVGDVAGRRPDLLAVHGPLVAVLHRLALQAGEVGAGARLAEQLAPPLLAGDDVVAVASASARRCRGWRWSGRRAAGRGRRVRRVRRSRRSACWTFTPRVAREPAAERIGGPGRCRPARGAEALPPFGDGELGIPVLLEPRLELGEDRVGVLVPCAFERSGVGACGGVGHGGTPWVGSDLCWPD